MLDTFQWERDSNPGFEDLEYNSEDIQKAICNTPDCIDLWEGDELLQFSTPDKYYDVKKERHLARQLYFNKSKKRKYRGFMYWYS